MARQGMEHWRRTVRWTFVGIFAVALIGGLVGRLTGIVGGRTTAASAAASEARQDATTKSKAPKVAPQTAARASAALLQLSDLPSGWVSGGAAAAPTRVSPWSHKLASCVGIPSRVAAIAPTKVQSPAFDSADKVDAVEDSVSVYPSAKDAQAEFTALSGSRTTGCMNRVASATLQKSMQQEAGSTTTVGVVSFTGLPAGAAALHLAGFTVTIPIASGGRVLTVTSTQVDFVSGTLLHQVTFNGNGTAFPAVLEEQLLATAKTHS